MSFKSFGIIGYGEFGEFLADSLVKYEPVLIYNRSHKKVGKGMRLVSLEEVCGADVLILAVPFEAFESILQQIKPLLSPRTLVVDVLSVKVEPERLLKKLLRDQPLLSTHPLFGPPSMKRIEPGLRVVVSWERGQAAKQFTNFLSKELGLKLVRVDAKTHDQAMAYMQALPFFIARALVKTGITKLEIEELEIPSFHKLLEIARIEQHHTPEMFRTSQLPNPYAKEARTRFIKSAQRLEDELS